MARADADSLKTGGAVPVAIGSTLDAETVRCETTMHKQNRQGWILLDDGTFLAVPVPLLAYEEITWPPTLPEIRPGLPAPLISEGDFYRRHEIVRGEAYVFLKAPLAPSDIPEDQILKLLGRSS